jgi:hypothetical protein
VAAVVSVAVVAAIAGSRSCAHARGKPRFRNEAGLCTSMSNSKLLKLALARV